MMKIAHQCFLSTCFVIVLLNLACQRPTPGAVVGASLARTQSNNAVNVFEVKPSPATSAPLIPAVLSVERTATVLAQREGTILALPIEEGARVTQGTILARLSDGELRSQLREAELEVNRSQIEERQHEAMVQVSLSELEQEKTLFKEGLTSRRQLERAEYKLDQSQQEAARVRLSTKSAQTRVEGLKVELEKTIIRAPLSGIITQRQAKLGALALKNDKLFELSQLSPLEVRFQLPIDQTAALSIAHTVELLHTDRERIAARARIRRLNTVADTASNTVGYVADVLGGNGLIPGQAVYVRLSRAETTTLWLPRAAFAGESDLQPGVTTTLFVLTNGKCAQRAVRIATQDGDQIGIASGLAIGDLVILAPSASLKDGDVVEVAAR